MAADDDGENVGDHGFINLPDPIQTELAKRHVRECYLEVYSSTCSEEDLIMIQAMHSPLGADIIIHTSNIEGEIYVPENKIVPAIDAGGRQVLRQYDFKRLILGRQLLVCCPIKDVTSSEMAEDAVASSVALLKLIFGDDIAGHRSFSCKYELNGGNWVYEQTSPSIIGASTILHDDLIDVEVDLSNVKFNLNPAAVRFLSLCDSELSNISKFLLLWTAMEAQLSEFPGGNSGKRRIDFFEKEIGSMAISKEIKRLHGIRSEIFKEGNTSSLKQAEIFSLLCALRLTALPKGAVRELLSGIYEERIEQFGKKDFLDRLPRYYRVRKKTSL